MLFRGRIQHDKRNLQSTTLTNQTLRKSSDRRLVAQINNPKAISKVVKLCPLFTSATIVCSPWSLNVNLVTSWALLQSVSAFAKLDAMLFEPYLPFLLENRTQTLKRASIPTPIQPLFVQATSCILGRALESLQATGGAHLFSMMQTFQVVFSKEPAVLWRLTFGHAFRKIHPKGIAPPSHAIYAKARSHLVPTS